MKPEQAVAFLLERQLLDARDLVQGEVVVSDHTYRNRNLRVECTTRPGYFIKHAPVGDVSSALATEAAVFRSAHQGGALAPLQPFIPEFHDFDEREQVLTIELLPKARTARERARAPGGLPPIGAPLGHVLAACHAAGREADSATRGTFSRMVPWAFHLAFPTPALYRTVSPIQIDILQLLQRDQAAAACIRRIKTEWQWDCFMHGDLRWENVLVEQEAGESEARVRLVDWESAGIGDPAWDLGTLMQFWIAHGIETLPLTDAHTPAEASALLAARLPELQRHIAAFWQSYVSSATLGDNEARVLRDRATAHAALRLLQSAYEWGQERRAMTSYILCCLQLGVNLARQSAPQRAALFGIGD